MIGKRKTNNITIEVISVRENPTSIVMYVMINVNKNPYKIVSTKFIINQKLERLVKIFFKSFIFIR